MSGNQLQVRRDAVGVDNFRRRNFPVECNRFERVAISHGVIHRLTVQVICDPFPAENIEAHHACTSMFEAVPFLIDHSVDRVAGGVQNHFRDGAIPFRFVLYHVGDADALIFFIYIGNEEDVIEALIVAGVERGIGVDDIAFVHIAVGMRSHNWTWGYRCE